MKIQGEKIVLVVSLYFVTLAAHPQEISGHAAGLAAVSAAHVGVMSPNATIMQNQAIGAESAQISTATAYQTTSVGKAALVNNVASQSFSAITPSTTYTVQSYQSGLGSFSIDNSGALPMNGMPINNNGSSQGGGANHGEIPGEPTTESMNAEAESYTAGFVQQNSLQHTQAPPEASTSVIRSQSASPLISASEVGVGPAISPDSN